VPCAACPMNPMRRINHLAAILVVASFVIGDSGHYARAQASEGKAPTAADRHETDDWLLDKDNGFRVPPGWKVEPILWQSAAQEGPSEVGLTISPQDGSPGGITYGGRGDTNCPPAESPECKCLSIYAAVYTCDKDSAARHVYDLFITTIRNECRTCDFTVVFPAAQDALHPRQRYTLRWRTKPGIPHHNVQISVRDTSKPDWREAMVLDVKGVPNIGRYEWLVPASITSPGPYLLEISFIVPEQVKPPALSGGRIYSGTSSPFYIQ
jgi:hypothetical protein